MIINFLFDRFLEPGLPTHNMIPTLSSYTNDNVILAPKGSMISWDSTQLALKGNNSTTSKHEIRFVNTADIINNCNPEEKNIYLIELLAMDFPTMWPLYYIPRGVIELVNNDQCMLVIALFSGFPLLSSGFDRLYTDIHKAVMFSGITNLNNLILMLDSGGTVTEEMQNCLKGVFSEDAGLNYLLWITDSAPKIGCPKVVESNTWEWIFIDKLNSIETDYLTRYLEKTHKPYSYLCLNNNLRVHRYMMFKATEYLNIKQDSIHSFRKFDTLDNYKNEYYFRTLFEETETRPIDRLQEFKEYLISNPDAEPVELPDDDGFKELVDTDFYNAIIKLDEKNLTNTYFSLVNETGFLSEKTFKLIYFGHPFILVGEPGILQDVKELGYRTFDCVFDESYDEMPSGPEKILFIAEQVKQYCGEEGRKKFAEKLPQIEEILRYNRELFMSKDHNDFWANL